MKSKCKFARFYKNISKISLLCSYAIFAARNEPEWIWISNNSDGLISDGSQSDGTRSDGSQSDGSQSRTVVKVGRF